jgi:carbon-monoxide dehydrogenase medium subunit
VLSKFNYVRPQDLEEALAYLEQNAGTKILAGGTDLMVMLRRNAEMPEHVLDIKAVPEIKRLEYKPQDSLFIGASVTVNQVAEAAISKGKYPALRQAANSLASYQLRNRATLVGNICNASPGADLAGPLLVYEANVHIANRRGNRIVPVSEFFTGVKKTVLQPGDIVTGVSLPDVEGGDNSIFLKQARIKGHDLGIVGVAVRLTAQNQFRIAMTAVAPTPIRLTRLEELMNAQPLTSGLANWAGEEVHQFIKPISDVRASAEYRLHAAKILIKRAVASLVALGGK